MTATADLAATVADLTDADRATVSRFGSDVAEFGPSVRAVLGLARVLAEGRLNSDDAVAALADAHRGTDRRPFAFAATRIRDQSAARSTPRVAALFQALALAAVEASDAEDAVLSAWSSPASATWG